MEKGEIGKSIMLIFTVLIIIALFTIVNQQYLKGEINESIKQFGLIGMFIVSFFLEFLPQYISPHAIIIISSLLDFDIWRAIFIIIIGSTLGSITGFEIGHKFKKKARLMERIIGQKKSKRFEKKVNKFGKIFVSLAAVSPLPYIPVVLGMIHLSRKNFIIYGIIPRITGLLIFGFLTIKSFSLI